MAIKFPKERILKMEQFYKRTDILSVILSDKEEYAISDVKKLLAKTLKESD